MYYIIIFLIVFISFKIVTSRDNALGWFVLGICTLYNGFHIGPLHTHVIFPLMLLISVIKYKNFWYIISKMPCIKSVIIFLLGIILVSLFDYNNSIIDKIGAISREFLTTIIILPCSYYLIVRHTNLNKFRTLVIISLLLMFMYAIIELITGSNIMHEYAINYFNDYAFKSSYDMYNTYSIDSDKYNRFRIESLPCFSFDYGYYSGILGLYILYLYSKNKKLIYLMISLVAGLGGCILSGSRTALIVTVIGYLVFLNFSVKRKLLYYLFLTSIIILFSTQISKIDVVNNTIDLITTGGKNTVGSSKEMRMDQLASSMYFFIQSPIVGKGFGYVENAMPYSLEKAKLLGTESIIYSTLIESGIIGIIYTITFIISTIIYFIKNKSIKESKLALSIIIAFIAWAIGTGVQGAWFITLPLIAYSMRFCKYSTTK